MNTNRYFLALSYDGTPFHGWQIQPNAETVQEKINFALSTVFRQKIETIGCGRTDTGVHASQFFAHFELENMEVQVVENSVSKINALLPYSIAVDRVFRVEDQAHARFDAIARTYQYHIHFKKNPFKINRSWLLKEELNVELMNEAAAKLLEHTDFSCFSKSNTQTFTNNCKISEAYFSTNGKAIVFTITADRFLRNMVRAIVGTLINIGKGTQTLQDFQEVIESKNRSKAGQSVPACGLYLVEIKYPYIKDE